MRELMKKEMTLTAAPLTYLFLAFGVMTMIPGYPILVGAFFVALGIFYTFQYAREYNDITYTALLPVRKSDVVKTKFAFTILIELIGFAVNALLTSVRMVWLADAGPYASNPMMNANLAYLGYVLLIFALFNIIFLTGFFKTAYYIGKPFVAFAIAAFLMVGLGETLHHIPGLAFLNDMRGEGLWKQGIVLILGAAVYIVGTAAALRTSIKRFDRIDL